MPDNNRIALITVADPHINSTVALCPKVVNKDDGGTYHASRTQRWLLECFLDYIEQAKILTEGYKRVGVFMGDLSELERKDRSNQIISPNKNTILNTIIETIAPLTTITDENIFIRGTAAHTGKSSWSEEHIASDIDNTIPSLKIPSEFINGKEIKKGIFSWWHYRGTAGGVKLDLAHHTSMGKKPWTRRNAANAAAAEIMWYYQVDRFVRAPDLALRAHVHTYATSADNFPCQVDCLPAWTTKTEYAYRIGYENAISDIGGIVYLCENGTFIRKKITYEPREEKRVWKLSM
jgi:hypothetical protein